MSHTLEIAKGATVAYNEKNWNKVQNVLSPESIHDEKATHRRLQGAGKIIEAWQGWGNSRLEGYIHPRDCKRRHSDIGGHLEG